MFPPLVLMSCLPSRLLILMLPPLVLSWVAMEWGTCTTKEMLMLLLFVQDLDLFWAEATTELPDWETLIS